MRNLSVGSVGPDVLRFQQALNSCMVPPNNLVTRPALARLVEDSKFGEKTKAMVREFQRLNGITVDGVIGPITSCLIFPFISFKVELAGQGRIKGLVGDFPNPLELPNRNAFNLTPGTNFNRPGNTFGVGPTPSAAPTPAPTPSPGGDDKERQGLTFELVVAAGSKIELKPWYVLKPEEPAEGAEATATLTAEATIVRTKGLEFLFGLEVSRLLKGEGPTWGMEGSIVGKYTNFKVDLGPGSVAVNPIVDLKLKQDLLFSTSAGLEAEASIQLIKDRLELSVGGKVAGEWIPADGNVKIGAEVSAGLKFKWDLVRTLGKK